MKKIILFIITFHFSLFTFHFVNAQTTYEGTDVPYIHPRSEWLTTPELQNLFSWYPYNSKAEGEIPDYSPVSRIIIHDTGCNAAKPGCNDETTPTITTIQNIFRFHSVTRGWGDIGYHFIIDRKGEIWEGRYGGNGVRAAHLYNNKTCQNFNVGTIGITLLGNYFDAQIPQPMLQSLNHLVAWLAYVNNIDLQSSPSTSIWTNAKTPEGKCQVNEGGFTTTYTGSTLLTHRDVEPANSDVKNIDLVVARNESSRIAQGYTQYAFKEEGSETLYEIVKAKLQPISDAGRKVITMLKSQLDFTKPELFAKREEPHVPLALEVKKPSFPDGTLLRARGDGDVYIIKNQKRIHISSAALFNGLSLNWNTIKETDPQTITTLVAGDPIVFPDGVLLKSDTPDVYYITQKRRYLISSPEQFAAYGFKWDDIVYVELKELDRYYPWGGYVKWPEGSILQNQFNKDEIVVVAQDTLQPFKEKIAKNTIVNSVTGREIASYQTASVATPAIKLVLSQTFDAIKETLGIQNSPITPLSPTPPATPTAQEPTIKIALCKNRETKNCPFVKEDKLEITTDDNGVAVVKGYEDHPGFNTSLNDNKFRGKVYTVNQPDGTVWLINELSLENYLKGIAETLGNDTPEYRKTLITVARTYAYHYITKEKRYPDKPYDLTNTSSDQVYRGFAYEDRSNGLGQVVDDTRGKIITFQGTPIVGAFSSDSGGITKNPCPSIFPKYCDANGILKPEFNYLKGGVTDPDGTVHDKAKIAASHGVGMSTTGARRLIELGKKAEDVITYYYPGVEIEKKY